jgi:hypothetical protein
VAQGGLRVVELHLRLDEFERRRHDGGRNADRGAGEQYARVKAEIAQNEDIVCGMKERESDNKKDSGGNMECREQEIPKLHTHQTMHCVRHRASDSRIINAYRAARARINGKTQRVEKGERHHRTGHTAIVAAKLWDGDGRQDRGTGCAFRRYDG